MLAKQVQSGIEPQATKARTKLFLCNLRYVINIAKTFANSVRCMQLEDLIQHGNLGLNRAITTFDPERGYKLSTYSRHWILQGIMSGISDEEYAIRLPRERRYDVQRVRKVTVELLHKLGRNPTMAEITEAAKVPAFVCELAAGVSNRPTSLDVPINELHTLADLIPEDKPYDDSAELPNPASLLPMLPERERMVVERYYGLNGTEPVPMLRIAEHLGVSRARVAQIKDKAVQRLRRNYMRMLSA